MRDRTVDTVQHGPYACQTERCPYGPAVATIQDRGADLQFGAWKARELAEELVALTANEPIQVHRGRRIVEITAAEVNKGSAVARILEQDEGYGIALCAGDDQTDESMFRLSTPRMLSIKVGDQPTQARYRIANPAAFRRFLEEVLTAA